MKKLLKIILTSIIIGITIKIIIKLTEKQKKKTNSNRLLMMIFSKMQKLAKNLLLF